MGFLNNFRTKHLKTSSMKMKRFKDDITAGIVILIFIVVIAFIYFFIEWISTDIGILKFLAYLALTFIIGTLLFMDGEWQVEETPEEDSRFFYVIKRSFTPLAIGVILAMFVLLFSWIWPILGLAIKTISKLIH